MDGLSGVIPFEKIVIEFHILLLHRNRGNEIRKNRSSRRRARLRLVPEFAMTKNSFDSPSNKDDLKVDIFGDLRYIRQSIIHNQGIAVSDIEKCRLFKFLYLL